jgi:MoxR-like ATPase
LPEAQLDRFLIRLDLGYPGEQEEVEILRRRRASRSDAIALPQLLKTGELLAMQSVLEEIFVEPTIEHYIVALVRATREEPRIALGGSPRASLALMKLSRAMAALDGRSFVTPDDVKAATIPVLAHRLVLRPEHWGGRVSTHSVVRSLLERIPTPAVEMS